MAILADDLDLGAGLAQVVGQGFAYLPHALAATSCRLVHEETAGGPFATLPPETGPYRVREDADYYRITLATIGAYPTVAALRDELVARVRASGGDIAGLLHWEPNDMAVQRYAPHSLGISPHRDGAKNAFLVAVFTTAGSAQFVICADRAGTVVAQWRTRPGGLVLLRGPGLAGIADGRPFHAVRGPRTAERHSLSYRMNTRL